MGRRRNERGSAAVELVLLTPLLVSLMLFVVALGRMASAEGTVDEWAYENVMNKHGKLTTLLEMFDTLAAEVVKPARKTRA